MSTDSSDDDSFSCGEDDCDDIVANHDDFRSPVRDKGKKDASESEDAHTEDVQDDAHTEEVEGDAVLPNVRSEADSSTMLTTPWYGELPGEWAELPPDKLLQAFPPHLREVYSQGDYEVFLIATAWEVLTGYGVGHLTFRFPMSYLDAALARLQCEANESVDQLLSHLRGDEVSCIGKLKASVRAFRCVRTDDFSDQVARLVAHADSRTLIVLKDPALSDSILSSVDKANCSCAFVGDNAQGMQLDDLFPLHRCNVLVVTERVLASVVTDTVIKRGLPALILCVDCEASVLGTFPSDVRENTVVITVDSGSTNAEDSLDNISGECHNHLANHAPNDPEALLLVVSELLNALPRVSWARKGINEVGNVAGVSVDMLEKWINNVRSFFLRIRIPDRDALAESPAEKETRLLIGYGVHHLRTESPEEVLARAHKKLPFLPSRVPTGTGELRLLRRNLEALHAQVLRVQLHLKEIGRMNEQQLHDLVDRNKITFDKVFEDWRSHEGQNVEDDETLMWRVLLNFNECTDNYMRRAQRRKDLHQRAECKPKEMWDALPSTENKGINASHSFVEPVASRRDIEEGMSGMEQHPLLTVCNVFAPDGFELREFGLRTDLSYTLDNVPSQQDQDHWATSLPIRFSKCIRGWTGTRHPGNATSLMHILKTQLATKECLWLHVDFDDELHRDQDEWNRAPSGDSGTVLSYEVPKFVKLFRVECTSSAATISVKHLPYHSLETDLVPSVTRDGIPFIRLGLQVSVTATRPHVKDALDKLVLAIKSKAAQHALVQGMDTLGQLLVDVRDAADKSHALSLDPHSAAMLDSPRVHPLLAYLASEDHTGLTQVGSRTSALWRGVIHGECYDTMFMRESKELLLALLDGGELNRCCFVTSAHAQQLLWLIRSATLHRYAHIDVESSNVFSCLRQMASLSAGGAVAFAFIRLRSALSPQQVGQLLGQAYGSRKSLRIVFTYSRQLWRSIRHAGHARRVLRPASLKQLDEKVIRSYDECSSLLSRAVRHASILGKANPHLLCLENDALTVSTYLQKREGWKSKFREWCSGDESHPWAVLIWPSAQDVHTFFTSSLFRGDTVMQDVQVRDLSDTSTFNEVLAEGLSVAHLVPGNEGCQGVDVYLGAHLLADDQQTLLVQRANLLQRKCLLTSQVRDPSLLTLIICCHIADGDATVQEDVPPKVWEPLHLDHPTNAYGLVWRLLAPPPYDVSGQPLASSVDASIVKTFHCYIVHYLNERGVACADYASPHTLPERSLPERSLEALLVRLAVAYVLDEDSVPKISFHHFASVAPTCQWLPQHLRIEAWIRSVLLPHALEGDPDCGNRAELIVTSLPCVWCTANTTSFNLLDFFKPQAATTGTVLPAPSYSCFPLEKGRELLKRVLEHIVDGSDLDWNALNRAGSSLCNPLDLFMQSLLAMSQPMKFLSSLSSSLVVKTLSRAHADRFQHEVRHVAKRVKASTLDSGFMEHLLREPSLRGLQLLYSSTKWALLSCASEGKESLLSLSHSDVSILVEHGVSLDITAVSSSAQSIAVRVFLALDGPSDFLSQNPFTKQFFLENLPCLDEGVEGVRFGRVVLEFLFESDPKQGTLAGQSVLQALCEWRLGDDVTIPKIRREQFTVPALAFLLLLAKDVRMWDRLRDAIVPALGGLLVPVVKCYHGESGRLSGSHLCAIVRMLEVCEVPEDSSVGELDCLDKGGVLQKLILLYQRSSTTEDHDTKFKDICQALRGHPGLLLWAPSIISDFLSCCSHMDGLPAGILNHLETVVSEAVAEVLLQKLKPELVGHRHLALALCILHPVFMPTFPLCESDHEVLQAFVDDQRSRLVSFVRDTPHLASPLIHYFVAPFYLPMSMKRSLDTCFGVNVKSLIAHSSELPLESGGIDVKLIVVENPLPQDVIEAVVQRVERAGEGPTDLSELVEFASTGKYVGALRVQDMTTNIRILVLLRRYLTHTIERNADIATDESDKYRYGYLQRSYCIAKAWAFSVGLGPRLLKPLFEVDPIEGEPNVDKSCGCFVYKRGIAYPAVGLVCSFVSPGTGDAFMFGDRPSDMAYTKFSLIAALSSFGQPDLLPVHDFNLSVDRIEAGKLAGKLAGRATAHFVTSDDPSVSCERIVVLMSPLAGIALSACRDCHFDAGVAFIVSLVEECAQILKDDESRKDPRVVLVLDVLTRFLCDDYTLLTAFVEKAWECGFAWSNGALQLVQPIGMADCDLLCPDTRTRVEIAVKGFSYSDSERLKEIPKAEFGAQVEWGEAWYKFRQDPSASPSLFPWFEVSLSRLHGGTPSPNLRLSSSSVVSTMRTTPSHDVVCQGALKGHNRVDPTPQMSCDVMLFKPALVDSATLSVDVEMLSAPVPELPTDSFGTSACTVLAPTLFHITGTPRWSLLHVRPGSACLLVRLDSAQSPEMFSERSTYVLVSTGLVHRADGERIAAEAKRDDYSEPCAAYPVTVKLHQVVSGRVVATFPDHGVAWSALQTSLRAGSIVVGHDFFLRRVEAQRAIWAPFVATSSPDWGLKSQFGWIHAFLCRNLLGLDCLKPVSPFFGMLLREVCPIDISPLMRASNNADMEDRCRSLYKGDCLRRFTEAFQPWLNRLPRSEVRSALSELDNDVRDKVVSCLLKVNGYQNLVRRMMDTSDVCMWLRPFLHAHKSGWLDVQPVVSSGHQSRFCELQEKTLNDDDETAMQADAAHSAPLERDDMVRHGTGVPAECGYLGTLVGTPPKIRFQLFDPIEHKLVYSPSTGVYVAYLFHENMQRGLEAALKEEETDDTVANQGHSERAVRWIANVIRSPLCNQHKDWFFKRIQDSRSVPTFQPTPDLASSLIAFGLAQACPPTTEAKRMMSSVDNSAKAAVGNTKPIWKRRDMRYGVIFCASDMLKYMRRKEVPMNVVELGHLVRSCSLDHLYGHILSAFTGRICYAYVCGLSTLDDRLLKWCCEYTEQNPWHWIMFEGTDSRFNFPETRDRCIFDFAPDFASHDDAVAPYYRRPIKFAHRCESRAESVDDAWQNEVPDRWEEDLIKAYRHPSRHAQGDDNAPSGKAEAVALSDSEDSAASACLLSADAGSVDSTSCERDEASDDGQCLLMIISPPGAGKTHVLEERVLGYENGRKHGRAAHRLDCSSDRLVEESLTSMLEQLFPSPGKLSALIADEYHLLTDQHKVELFNWIEPRLYYIKVVLVGNRMTSADRDRMEEVRGRMSSMVCVKVLEVRLSIDKFKLVAGSKGMRLSDETWRMMRIWLTCMRSLLGDEVLSLRMLERMVSVIAMEEEPKRKEMQRLVLNKVPMLGAYGCELLVDELLKVDESCPAMDYPSPSFLFPEASTVTELGTKEPMALLVRITLLDHNSKYPTFPQFVGQLANSARMHPMLRLRTWAKKALQVAGVDGAEKLWPLESDPPMCLVDQPRFPEVIHPDEESSLPGKESSAGWGACEGYARRGNYKKLEWVQTSLRKGYAMDWATASQSWKESRPSAVEVAELVSLCPDPSQCIECFEPEDICKFLAEDDCPYSLSVECRKQFTKPDPKSGAYENPYSCYYAAEWAEFRLRSDEDLRSDEEAPLPSYCTLQWAARHGQGANTVAGKVKDRQLLLRQALILHCGNVLQSDSPQDKDELVALWGSWFAPLLAFPWKAEAGDELTTLRALAFVLAQSRSCHNRWPVEVHLLHAVFHASAGKDELRTLWNDHKDTLFCQVDVKGHVIPSAPFAEALIRSKVGLPDELRSCIRESPLLLPFNPSDEVDVSLLQASLLPGATIATLIHLKGPVGDWLRERVGRPLERVDAAPADGKGKQDASTL